jgi:hypothetical protein
MAPVVVVFAQSESDDPTRAIDRRLKELPSVM